MEGKLSESISYAQKIGINPRYKFTRRDPNSGSNTVPLSSGSQTITVFDIPADVWNASKSILSFTLDIAAMAVAPAVVPPQTHNVVFRDCLPFWDQIQLTTRSGLDICNIQYANTFHKTTAKYETKFTDYMENGDDTDLIRCNSRKALLAGAVSGAAGAGAFWGSSAVGVATDRNLTGILAAATAAIPISDPLSQRYDGTEVDVQYTETKYLTAFGGATPNIGKGQINYNIPLSAFKQSFLAYDKDFYTTDVIQLRLTWAPYVKFGFSSIPVLVPATGVTNYSATAVPFLTACQLLNLYLFVATEQDPLLRNKIIDETKSGKKYLIPYVHSSKTSLTAVSSSSVQNKYSRAHGLRLKKVYTSCINGAETILNTFNIDAKAVSIAGNYYYSMLNSYRLEDFNVDRSGADQSCMLVQYKLKGSVIQSKDMFQYNHAVVTSFDDAKSKSEETPEDANVMTGIDLSSEQTFTVYYQYSAAADRNYYQFAVVERELMVSPMGVTLM